MRFHRLAVRLTALGGLVLASSCAPDDFDTSRSPPPRGTVGEEMYGVVCDRVGAQALGDDPTGASFYTLCHKTTDAPYTEHVDVSQLPPIVDGALDVDGNPVSVDVQNQHRAHAIARLEAFVRRRAEVIGAIDATFPDVAVAVTDNKNPDATKSCLPPAASGEGRLHSELADLLGRFTSLYDDGTIPESTESLARVMNAFKASPPAQAALARFDARKGYRPIELALGATRPVMAYPHLRDLSNATLSLLSADSKPYDPSPTFDDTGRRVLVPGGAYPQLTKLLEVAHAELRDVQPDPTPIALPKPVQDPSGRYVLLRPRTSLEIAQELANASDPAFGGGASRFIVRRDTRGYAAVAMTGTTLPTPFLDADQDGLPDIDSLGRFLTANGTPALTPFFAIGGPAGPRDPSGLALGTDGKALYDYLDTSHTLVASLIADLKPLVNGDVAAKHETLMYALAGAQVLLGDRDQWEATSKVYSADPSRVDDWKVAHPGEAAPADLATAPVTLKYDAFHPETSPLVDLAYAMGQLLGDPTSDDTLAFAKEMITNHTADVARLAGDMIFAKEQFADPHPEAHIPATSVFWDEMIDFVVLIEKEPGLLEDLLTVFSNDETARLGSILGQYMTYKDHISYDRTNLNGGPVNVTTGDHSELKTPVDRTQPDSGDNRSAFQRFVQTVHDTNGVAACNKEGALVHAAGTALGNLDLPSDSNLIVRLNYGTKSSFRECEVFKIDNVGKFYIQSIAGAATLYFRDKFLRDGFLGIGASTVDVVQKSSGLEGFYDATTSTTFRPQPRWLNRLVFFDLRNDSPNPGNPNYLTNHFLADLQGDHFTGTTVCPERVIPDPSPDSPDASPDKKVHGLRACKDGDWFPQRDADAMFVFEDFGFYNALAPIVKVFVDHKREDLFIQMMEVVYKHWQDDKGTASECSMGLDASGKVIPCSKDGLVTYEPVAAGVLGSDLMLALHDITKVISTLKISHCAEVDPTTHACTKPVMIDANTVLAESTRAAVDPDLAKAAALTDRTGNVLGMRNDGTTNPQVTPLYLILQALNASDTRLAAWDTAHKAEPPRMAQWKAARSQLVDQFLDVDGKGTSVASFKNTAIPKMAPLLLDVLRAQLWAQCPDSFTPPYTRCDWARSEMTKRMVDTMKGPTFAAALDVVEAIRKNDAARTQLEMLASYLLDKASTNDARAAVTAALADAVQMMGDDTNLVPLFHVLSAAAAPSLVDAKGHVVRKSLADAQLSMLARVDGRAFDASGTELCSQETDPNQVLPVALQNLVTPMKASDGSMGETPIEILMDVVADVNRATPGATDKLRAEDYASIADQVSSFLLDEEHGMEQFYEIVRQGTVHE